MAVPAPLPATNITPASANATATASDPALASSPAPALTITPDLSVSADPAPGYEMVINKRKPAYTKFIIKCLFFKYT